MPPFARLRDVVPSAYLRVFQPLDGFERREQAHWERYLVEGARSPSLRRRYADHETTEGLGVLAPAEGEHAEVRVIDGRTFVSPWRMHLRVLAALLSFSATKPLELSDRFVPKQDGEARRQGAGEAPSSRPGGGGVRASEPVARADPVVRAVRRRRALAGGGRVRPDPAALPHHGASRDAPRGARRPGPAPDRPGSDLRADPGPAPVAGRVRPARRCWSSTTRRSATS